MMQSTIEGDLFGDDTQTENGFGFNKLTRRSTIKNPFQTKEEAYVKIYNSEDIVD
jgi:hypothetical protein